MTHKLTKNSIKLHNFSLQFVYKIVPAFKLMKVLILLSNFTED